MCAWTAGGIIMSHHLTYFDLMPFTPLLVGSHQPMSACSFLYKSCKMDSNTWKKTPGVRKLITSESLYVRWRILTNPQEVDHIRKVAIIDEELINVMWPFPHAKLLTAVPFIRICSLYNLHLLHEQRMKKTRQKFHLPERAYLEG